jgi:hypothetical protein
VTEVRILCNTGVDAGVDVVVEIVISALLIRDKRGVKLVWACGFGEMR